MCIGQDAEIERAQRGDQRGVVRAALLDEAHMRGGATGGAHRVAGGGVADVIEHRDARLGGHRARSQLRGRADERRVTPAR